MKRFIVLAVLAIAGCESGSREDAEAAVRTYVSRLAEAYRAGDSSLVDPLVGDEQGLKILGLIGVKQDAGVVLDSKLLELQFVRVERERNDWVVETRERWYYRDRKVGTGEQVGEDSTDSYALRYRFARKDKRLVLEDLTFTEEPVVGRKSAPMPIEPRVLHGLPPERTGTEGVPPPGQPPLRGAHAEPSGTTSGGSKR